MHTVREAIPETSALSKAELTTIRERLLKIGARVVQAACVPHDEFLTRIRVQLPTSCPEQAVFAATAAALIAPAPCLERQGERPAEPSATRANQPQTRSRRVPKNHRARRIAGLRPPTEQGKRSLLLRP